MERIARRARRRGRPSAGAPALHPTSPRTEHHLGEIPVVGNHAVEGASDHERSTDDELQKGGDRVPLLVTSVDEVTIDAEDRVIPPPADGGAEEPHRREVEAVGRERLAVYSDGAADPAPLPARATRRSDVLHDDDL